jgi:glucose uptake protein GlcU
MGGRLLVSVAVVGVTAAAAHAKIDDTGGSIGWIAAAIAAISYGSYGVPIKATLDLEVHPFVLQSYKTTVLFLMSWCALMLDHHLHRNDDEDTPSRPFFTPWGLLSGLLWVVGGTGGIYGIRNAGMATAVGTWASVMVLVNFVWGILIFKEPMRSFPATVAAFLLLCVGLIGMSKYSAPSASSSSSMTPLTRSTSLTSIHQSEQEFKGFEEPELAVLEDSLLATKASCDSNSVETTPVAATTTISPRVKLTSRRKGGNSNSKIMHDERNSSVTDIAENDLGSGGGSQEMTPFLMTTVVDDDDVIEKLISTSMEKSEGRRSSTHVVLCSGRVVLTKRRLGIACSVFNGLFSGSSLIPLHYAKSQGFGGLAYIPSFAIGALLSNLSLWGVYLFINCCSILHHRSSVSTLSIPQQQQHYEDGMINRGGLVTTVAVLSPSILKQAMAAMPQFHFKVLWFRGFVAGLLLSIAMFGSILSTTYLGQGVGNSLVQTKILISGLWGIFWYKEITDRRAITNWFLSAVLCVFSILWLSYERLAVTRATTAAGARELPN